MVFQHLLKEGLGGKVLHFDKAFQKKGLCWAVGIGGVSGDSLGMCVYVPSVCVHVQNISPDSVFFKYKQ